MYNRFYIRTDDWVLIGDNRGQERRMYDLRSDPHEFFDVLVEVATDPRHLAEDFFRFARRCHGSLPSG
jgi:hypothetical protein